MQNTAYYRTGVQNDNRMDVGVPLFINCCGVVNLSHPFTTHSDAGRHDFYFLYMAEGELHLRLPNLTARLQAGDLVVMPPETPYHYALAQGTLRYYWVHFTGASCEALLRDCCIPMSRVAHPGSDTRAQELLNGLFHAFVMRDDCFDTESSSTFALLLARLCHLLKKQEQGPHRLRASLEYLHRHYTEPLTLATLSALEYLSPSRYSALFRAQMGVSPQQYLIALRMQIACNLIESTDMPLQQVALAVGYQDQLYFSRVFHRTYGRSPSAWRRKASSPSIFNISSAEKNR